MNIFKNIIPKRDARPGDRAQAGVPPELILTRNDFLPTTLEVNDEELKQTIPEDFYKEDFDATRYILENLPEKLDDESLGKELRRRERMMEIIDSELSDVIMQNYRAFVTGMQNVQEFGNDLKITTILLNSGRKHLQKAKAGLTGGGVQIVSKARKSKILTAIATDVVGIKNIGTNAQLMNAALESGDYPTAVELCFKCFQDSNKLKHYECVADYPQKFQDTFEQIEDKMESKLLDVCRKFKPELYERILQGFVKLGKLSRVVEQFQTHFAWLVDTIAHDIVLEFVLKSNMGNDKLNPDRLRSKPFKELCTMLTDDEYFIGCFRKMLEMMCNIMLNHYAITRWHDLTTFPEETEKLYNDIEQKLKRNRKALWDDIQRKVSLCLGSRALNIMKLESFLTVLNYANRFITIGDAFVGQQSTIMRAAVKQHSISYFVTTHRSRMEDLRAMLENEAWHPCPVPAGYSLKHFKEFDFSSNVILSIIDPAKANMRIFEENLEKGFSFAETQKTAESIDQSGAAADTNDDEDDDVPEELKRDYIEEDDTPSKKQTPAKAPTAVASSKGKSGGATPLLATATINVVRLIGRYISMAEVLSPIAYDVMMGLAQVVEYYLFTLFKFFAGDVVTTKIAQLNDSALPPKLRSTLVRLQERFDDNIQEGLMALHENQSDAGVDRKFPVPSLSGTVQLKKPDELYGLPARVIGTESMLFIHSVLVSVKERLERLMPATQRPLLLQFYTQTVDNILELRMYMYKAISRRFMNYSNLLDIIASVDWDTKEVGFMHNPYVDSMLKSFLTFKTRLEGPTMGIIPQEVRDIIWRNVIIQAMEMLVEGFSRARKCSNEGRALMQLDCKVFINGLEKLTTLRPIPHTKYLDGYIKAYYLSKEEVEQWVGTNRNYTPKQMAAVINVGVGKDLPRQLRQKVMNMVEELDKAQRR